MSHLKDGQAQKKNPFLLCLLTDLGLQYIALPLTLGRAICFIQSTD